MTIQDLFTSIAERVQDRATVSTIYGEPITAEGRTLIPVARVAYGFGGGGGSQQARAGENGVPQALGGGGGGGAIVTPVGFIELTAGETRYVSIEERRKIIRAALIAGVAGLFLLRRRRRS